MVVQVDAGVARVMRPVDAYLAGYGFRVHVDELDAQVLGDLGAAVVVRVVPVARVGRGHKHELRPVFLAQVGEGAQEGHVELAGQCHLVAGQHVGRGVGRLAQRLGVAPFQVAHLVVLYLPAEVLKCELLPAMMVFGNGELVLDELLEDLADVEGVVEHLGL